MSVEFDPDIHERPTNGNASGDDPATDTMNTTDSMSSADSISRANPAESTDSIRPTDPEESTDPADDDAPSGVFERVLVVTDGEATGRAAVDAGLDIAAAHGATVDALYVVDTTEAWDVAVERHERAGEVAVEEAEARGGRLGVDTRKWFRYGAAHEETLSFAAAHDVDLIVVGSARRTGLDRLVHPETLPVRVQRCASAPVLVVGTDETE